MTIGSSQVHRTSERRAAAVVAGTSAPDRVVQGALLAVVGSGALLSASARLVESGEVLLTAPGLLLALPGIGLAWHARDLLRLGTRRR
jgi:hypothetical protein